jgi:Sec-independent protein secretion pathway component TatC
MSVESKLSSLWVFVVLNMLYADILSLMDKTFLNQVLAGQAGSIHITSGFLLLAAVMLEIPIVMIVLSRVLPVQANRLANIAAAVITALFVIGGGSTAPHYLFLATMELVGMLLIIRYAWHWPSREPS